MRSGGGGGGGPGEDREGKKMLRVLIFFPLLSSRYTYACGDAECAEETNKLLSKYGSSKGGSRKSIAGHLMLPQNFPNRPPLRRLPLRMYYDPLPSPPSKTIWPWTCDRRCRRRQCMQFFYVLPRTSIFPIRALLFPCIEINFLFFLLLCRKCPAGNTSASTTQSSSRRETPRTGTLR